MLNHDYFCLKNGIDGSMNYSETIHPGLINDCWPQEDSWVEVKRELALLTEGQMKERTYDLMLESELAGFSDESLKKLKDEFEGSAESELYELMSKSASAGAMGGVHTLEVCGNKITPEMQPIRILHALMLKLAMRCWSAYWSRAKCQACFCLKLILRSIERLMLLITLR